MKRYLKSLIILLVLGLVGGCSTPNDLNVSPGDTDHYLREARNYFEKTTASISVLEKPDEAGLSRGVLENFRKNIVWERAVITEKFIDVPVGDLQSGSIASRVNYQFGPDKSSSPDMSAGASETHIFLYKRENDWRAFYIKIMSHQKMLTNQRRTVLNYRVLNPGFTGTEIRYNLSGKMLSGIMYEKGFVVGTLKKNNSAIGARSFAFCGSFWVNTIDTKCYYSSSGNYGPYLVGCDPPQVIDTEYYEWSCDGNGGTTSSGSLGFIWTVDAAPPGYEDIVKLLARNCITNLPSNTGFIVCDKNNWESYKQYFDATGDAPIERFSRQEGLMYDENGEPRYGVCAKAGNSVFIVVCVGLFKQNMELQAAEVIGHEMIHAFHHQEHGSNFDEIKSEYAAYAWSRNFWLDRGYTGRAKEAQIAMGSFPSGIPYYKSDYNPTSCN